MNRKTSTLALLSCVISLIITLPLVSGCDAREGAWGETGVLVDVSDSTSGMWQSYCTDLHQLADALPDRERVFADKISDNSAAMSDPYKGFFGKKGGDPTPLRDKAEAKKAREEFANWIDHVFEHARLVGKHLPEHGQQPMDNTDILTSIKNMEPFFKGGPKGKPKRLIICSDMVEQSQTLDLTAGTLSPKEIEDDLNRLQEQGLVPDLEGVTVWLVGINADRSNSLTATRLAKIRRFWLGFFKRAKAVPDEAHWGARLLLDGSDWG